MNTNMTGSRWFSEIPAYGDSYEILSESYLMNTNMTGSRRFSNLYVLVLWANVALELELVKKKLRASQILGIQLYWTSQIKNNSSCVRQN